MPSATIFSSAWFPTGSCRSGTSSFTFGPPTDIPYTRYTSTNFSFQPYTFSFTTAAAQQAALLFGGSVYAAMSAEAGALQPSPLPPPAQLVGQVIQFYANLPTDGATGGKYLTGQVRDIVKSILRGVWDFIAIPDQNAWYPNPATPTPDAMVDGKPATVRDLQPRPLRLVRSRRGEHGGIRLLRRRRRGQPRRPGPRRGPGFDTHQPDLPTTCPATCKSPTAESRASAPRPPGSQPSPGAKSPPPRQ